MKCINQNALDSSSKKTFEEDESQRKIRHDDEVDITDAAVTNKVDEMTVKNGTALVARAIFLNEYREDAFFKKILNIEDRDITVRDAGMPYACSLSVSFRTYGFDYFRRPLCVTFYLQFGAE